MCETILKLGNDDTKHIYQNIKNLFQNNTYSYSKAGKSSRHLKTRFLLEVTIKRCFQCHMGNRRDRGKHFHPYFQLALLTEKPVLTQESVNACASEVSSMPHTITCNIMFAEKLRFVINYQKFYGSQARTQGVFLFNS